MGLAVLLRFGVVPFHRTLRAQEDLRIDNMVRDEEQETTYDTRASHDYERKVREIIRRLVVFETEDGEDLSVA